MTAVDYTARVAELLGEHFADEGLNTCEAKRCTFETWDLPFPERLAAFATHQAEVLAAAGLIPTRTEWGVRLKIGQVHSTVSGRRMDEEDARDIAGAIGIVVSRAVTDWKDAT